MIPILPLIVRITSVYFVLYLPEVAILNRSGADYHLRTDAFRLVNFVRQERLVESS